MKDAEIEEILKIHMSESMNLLHSDKWLLLAPLVVIIIRFAFKYGRLVYLPPTPCESKNRNIEESSECSLIILNLL